MNQKMFNKIRNLFKLTKANDNLKTNLLNKQDYSDILPNLFSIQIDWKNYGIDSRISPCGRMRVRLDGSNHDDYIYYEILIDSEWHIIATKYYNDDYNGFVETIDGSWIPEFTNWLNSVRLKQIEYFNSLKKKEEEQKNIQQLEAKQKIETIKQKWKEYGNV